MIISNFGHCRPKSPGAARDKLRKILIPQGVSEKSSLKEAGETVESFFESHFYDLMKHDTPRGFGPGWDPDYTPETTYEEIVEDIWHETWKFYAKLDYFEHETNDARALLVFFGWYDFPLLDQYGKTITGDKNWKRADIDWEVLAELVRRDVEVNGVLRIRSLAGEWFMAVHGMDLEWLTRVQLRMQEQKLPGVEWSSREMEDFSEAVHAVKELAGLEELLARIRWKAEDPENRRLI